MQNPGDMLISVYRVFELDQAWQHGILYPRLGPNLNFGLGAPLFQFYPPLVSYGALLFHKLGLGFIAATKAMLALNLLLSALGVFFYLRWLTGRRLGAVTAAVVFVFSQYLLVVIYERGAAAESTALALLPWLVWTTHRLLYDKSFSAVSRAALCVALVMLAHNITGLFVVPATLLYGAILSLYGRNSGALARVGAAFALGLALSAFYWLPALTELRYTLAESMMLGELTDVTHWLIAPSEVTQSTLAVALAGPERFHIGLLTFLFGVGGLLTLPWQNRNLRFNAAILSLAWIVILLLQVRGSELIWDNVPLIRFVQFPWRLFGLATLCIVLVLGMMLNADRFDRLPRAVQATLCAAIMLTAAIAGVANLRVEALPLWVAIPEDRIGLIDLYDQGKQHSPLYIDYTPVSMRIYGSGIANSRPAKDIEPLTVSPAPTITVNRVVRGGFELSVNAPAAFPLRAPRAYFPGWQIYVDGAPVPTAGSGPLGLVTAEIPPGEHQVRIQFDQTPLRAAADFLSLAALAVIVAGSILTAPLPHKRLWLAAAGVTALGVFLLVRQAPLTAAAYPTAYGANLDNKVQLIAYQIDDKLVAPGASLPVKLYWYVQETPVEERKVFIHINQPDDSGRVAQNDQLPLMSYYPTSQWEGGQIFVDEYHVAIPADAPPGRYTVTAGMYRPDPLQNLPVLTGPDTWPGDRMKLGEIEIAHGD